MKNLLICIFLLFLTDLYPQLAKNDQKILELSGINKKIGSHKTIPFTIENLLPKPQEIQKRNGSFTISSQTTIFHSNEKPLKLIIGSFQEMVEEKQQWHLKSIIEKEKNKYQIWISNQVQIPKSILNSASKIKSLGEEAYELIVHEKGIQLIGGSEKGLRWGLKTLSQMMEKEMTIPAIKITDWPRYRWRGYMLDLGRAPFSVAQIKRTIRICSAFKLNFLMLREADDELNAFKYDHLPLGHKNPYALTLIELADIVDYGNKHGITVFPEIESLGHAAAKRLHYPDLIEGDMLTAYWPGFTHLRKANLKVGDPRTYELLEAIYEELFPIFDSPIVHLGLDEVRLPKKAQAEHLNRLLPIVDKVGKKNGHKMDMIVWSDAPLTPPEFHDQVIRCLWVYDIAISPNNKYVQKQGFNYLTQPNCPQKVFMSGGSGTLHTPYTKGNYRDAFENLATWAMLGEKYQNFIGLLAVQWGTNIIDEWFPNFLMTADFGWNVPKEMPHYESYIKNISSHLQNLNDFVAPDPNAVDRPVWDGIWLNGKNWEEDIITGQKAAPVVQIDSSGSLFRQTSNSIRISSNFPNAKIYYTLDGSDPNRQSNLYLDPFQVNKTTVIKARALLAGRPPSYIATQIFSNLALPGSPENGKLFHDFDYDFYQTQVHSVFDLSSLKPTRSGKVDQVKIPSYANKKEAYGVIFNGYLDIQKEGLYTFYLMSNDESKLLINDKELIDIESPNGKIEKSGKISLKMGIYPINVKYYQKSGEQALKVSWKGPGFEKIVLE